MSVSQSKTDISAYAHNVSECLNTPWGSAAGVESIPVAIVRVALDLTIVSWNSGAERILGYSAAEMVGCSATRLAPPDRLAEQRAILESIKNSQQVVELETYFLDKGGRQVAIYLSVSPIENDQGNIVGAGEVFSDISERKRMTEQRTFELAVANALSQALSLQETLQTVANLMVPFLADNCQVEILEGSFIGQIAVAHRDPEKAALLREMRRRYPPDPSTPYPHWEALRTGEPRSLPAVPDTHLVRIAQDAAHLEMLRRLRSESRTVAPLLARGRVLGVLCLESLQAERYGPVETHLIKLVAHRAALAIDNACLFEAERQALRTAEGANRRLARLQETMVALSCALTPHDVARGIANQGMKPLGLISGWIAVITGCGAELLVLESFGDELEILDIFAQGVAVSRDGRRLPLNLSSPITDAVRTGRTVVVRSWDEMSARYPQLTASVPPQNGCWFAAPLLTEGEVLGAIVFAMREPNLLSKEDHAFVVALGQQCALAMHRALLQAQVESERARLEAVLQQMPCGVLISEASSGRTLLRNEQSERILGVSVARNDHSAVAPALHWWSHPDGRRYQPDELPMARAISTGEVVRNEEIDFVGGDGRSRTLSSRRRTHPR